VQALTSVELCGFSFDMLRQGIRHPKFSERIAERYYDYIRVMEDRLIYVSRYAAAARIASLILHLRERLARNGFLEGDVMDFPLTQSHVADALGLTAAHVNRMFAELRNDGILTFGSGQLTIHDLARLADLVKSPGG
ncbi:MAG: Crp/Fnr family transcriptional regulator, partial [Alphaproteobacteria bacterium]